MGAAVSVKGCCTACINQGPAWQYFTFVDGAEETGCWCHQARGTKEAKKGFMYGIFIMLLFYWFLLYSFTL